MADLNAPLCNPCELIFRQHWVSKESFEPSGHEMDLEAVIDAASQLGSDYELHEAPDWVTLGLEGSGEYTSPIHHTVEELEKSATAGCRLCVMFWDMVQDEVGALADETKVQIGNLASIAVARPGFDPVTEEEAVDLELSYFGDIQKFEGYAFTCGLKLCRIYGQFVGYIPCLWYVKGDAHSC